MPVQTPQAISWALQQKVVNHWGIEIQVTKDNPPLLVHMVREYFNTNGIAYSTFSYDDLKPYLV